MKRFYFKLKTVIASLALLFSANSIFAQADIVAVPVAGCDGADGLLALSDPNPIAYDVDIYMWDPVAMAVVGTSVNMYSGNATPNLTVPTPDPMTCDCVDAPGVEIYFVPWQDPFTMPSDGTFISGPHVTSSCPALTETIVAPDCAGTTPSVTYTSPDGSVCFTMDGIAGEDPLTTCPTDPIDGELNYSYTAFPGTACETVYTMNLSATCECSCPTDLGTYTDPMELVCGPGNLPSNIPTIADLVDVPAGATLTWDIDPTDPANAPDATTCGVDDVVVFTGTVTCNLDASTIVTVTYTITDQCAIADCGGNLCDVAIANTSFDACADFTIEMTDANGVDPDYDVDLYLYNSDTGASLGYIGNLFNLTNQTLDITNTAMTCNPEMVNFQVEVVCWQDGDPGLDGGLVSIPFTVTFYPVLTVTTVNPDCAGAAGSHTVTSPDGSVCDVVMGTAGGNYCLANGDAAMDADLPAYSNTFFAGTTCETTLTAAAYNENCEVCTCPMDLATYTDPMEAVCGGPAAPSMIPTLADLVDNPSGATLSWDVDPTADVDPQSCTEMMVTYTGTVTCNLDATTIVTVTYTFVVYPTLTVNELAPDCTGGTGSWQVLAPDGLTICDSGIGVAGSGADCGTAMDGTMDYSSTFFGGTACEVTFSNSLTTTCPPSQCGGAICDIVVLNTPLEACGDLNVQVHDVNANGDPTSYDPLYDADLYLYDADNGVVAGTPTNFIGNLFTTAAVDIDVVNPNTSGCTPLTVNYQIEVVCWQDGDPGFGGGLISVPFSITWLPTDPACNPDPVYVSGPSAATPGCTDAACPAIGAVTMNTLTVSCPAGFAAVFDSALTSGGTLANPVDNGDGTYSVDVTPDCTANEVSVSIDCECGATVAISVQSEDVASSRTDTDFACPFGFGAGCAMPILPIELGNFNAFAIADFNKIEWSTVSEINNEWQIIERSIDGVNDWHEIGRKAGQTISHVQRDYELFDRAPLTKSYYRLRSVDFDGFTEISEVISVIREGNVISEFTLTAVPNPFTETTSVMIYSNFNEDAVISILDVTGKVIMSKDCPVTLGANQVPIDATNFDSGIYFVNLNSANANSTVRIIKK